MALLGWVEELRAYKIGGVGERDGLAGFRHAASGIKHVGRRELAAASECCAARKARMMPLGGYVLMRRRSGEAR